MVDLAILSRVVPTLSVAPPTVNIGVVGYYKCVERDPCPVASVKKSVMQKIEKEIKYELISAAKSIGYWPIDTKEHEKRALHEHLDRLLRSQILCHEILPPVPGNVLKKFRCGCKT